MVKASDRPKADVNLRSASLSPANQEWRMVVASLVELLVSISKLRHASSDDVAEVDVDFASGSIGGSTMPAITGETR